MIEPLHKALTFEYKLIHDDRTPAATFELVGQRFGLLLPSPAFWINLYELFLLQSVITIAFTVVIYKCIVQQRGKSSTYLLGYALLLPLYYHIPFWIMDALQLENKFIKMSTMAVPTALGFATLEAMHGTSPKSMEHSLKNYVRYTTALVEFQWDDATNQRKPVTGHEVVRNLTRFGLHFMLLSLLASALIPYNFEPFSGLSSSSTNLVAAGFGHLANNYLAALFFYWTLSIGLCGGEAINNFASQRSFDNPFWLSTGVADFWSRRWNLTVARMLKRGFYEPLRYRAGCSSAVASMATFWVDACLLLASRFS